MSITDARDRLPTTLEPGVPAPRRPGPGEEDPGEDLPRRYKGLDSTDSRAPALHERLAVFYAPVMKRLAGRYRGRGEPVEDLYQAAMVGLCKAIRNFDPRRGTPFLGYLMPTATGEVKRHFRDHTWAIRVPRRHQENRVKLRRVIGQFQQDHARTPTIADIAQEMKLPEAEVSELVQASESYRSLSLDTPDFGEAGHQSGNRLEERLGQEDEGLERVVQRQSLKPALARLAERERTILWLRFFGEHTQSEIADRVGCSQMHVSRLLSGALAQLRHDMRETTMPARC